jgi:hypothetical protein
VSGLYIGNPLDGGMVKMPLPPRGYKNTFDRNVRQQTLIGGGASTARGLYTRQSFEYGWDWRASAEYDAILGFYNDSWGTGPFTVLDPSARNYQRQDTTLMGSRRGVLTGWAASAGTIAYDSTVAANQAPSGVTRWTGAGNGSTFGEGVLVAGVVEADQRYATPYVATEPYTVRVYGKTATSTASVTARVSARNAANTLHTDTAGSPVTLNTSTWQAVTASATAGFAAGAQYVILTLLCSTASAPNILLSNPSLELASSANPWVVGTGAPRCVVIGTADSAVQFVQNRPLMLKLQEI